VLPAALAALVGCENAKPPIAPTKPAVVLVSQPVSDEIVDYEEFTGRTDAFQFVEIRARVTGYLDKILFKDGSDVEEGAQLFLIDPRPYQAEVDRAEAAVIQSEAHRNTADANHRRAVTLFNRGVMSREEFDRITGDFEEAKAAVGIAKANRDRAKLDLGFTRVNAPISGRVSRRQVDIGHLVQADMTILTTIVKLDPMYVYFDIDERTMLRLRRLLASDQIRSLQEAEVPVLVGLSDESDFPHHGTINFSDNKVDSGTGTLRIRGIIANPKPRILSPGMFVRIRLPIGKKKKRRRKKKRVKKGKCKVGRKF